MLSILQIQILNISQRTKVVRKLLLQISKNYMFQLIEKVEQLIKKKIRIALFGIDEFTAIINPPDACILAVGTVKEGVGVVNGEIKVVKTMKVTLSCDHRVVDGTMGADFLKTVREYLEEPVKLLV